MDISNAMTEKELNSKLEREIPGFCGDIPSTRTVQQDSLSSSNLLFDPFQIFEISPKKCHIIQVQVVDGKDIARGWLFSILHTPDLYVFLDISNTPNGHRRTKTIKNCGNPRWDETFTFLVNPDAECVLEVVLMNANTLRRDSRVGGLNIDMATLPLGEQALKEIYFGKGSQIQLSLLRTEDNSTSDLRFSLALSDEEKEFRKKRGIRVFQATKAFLSDEEAPRDISEVPTIGVLGSGGGFRAMVAMSGAMQALDTSGLLDCTTYLATLSGASWYVSYLYSQPEYPARRPQVFHERLRGSVCQNNWLKLLTPNKMYGYIAPVLSKSRSGQPVSLTDFYGHLVGDTILRELKDISKLSSQASKLDEGQTPMPLYTCINVKKNVSARVFQDWMEFSPYEIGFAKYGTFMKTAHFGSKFFMGKLLRRFDEPPLHYLQGVWGSAFCILFKRLIQEKERRYLVDGSLLRLSEQQLIEDEESILKNYTPKDDDPSPLTADSWSSDEYEQVEHSFGSVDQQAEGGRNNISNTSLVGSTAQFLTSNSAASSSRDNLHSCERMTVLPNRANLWVESRRSKCSVSKHEVHKSFWEKTVDNLFKSNLMNTRAGRAGVIYNPLRGLNLAETFPLSPFHVTTTPDDDVDFKGYYEPTEVNAKRMFLVDSGLTFNLPYPLLMRPQRGVDIYLSFDFSVRLDDETTPFKEILLAAKWAKLNEVSFPPIQELVDKFSKEPLREFYLFEDPADPYCPIIIHYILLNKKFRCYKQPGVERATDEEIEFANFSMFSDPKHQYSVFNFAYTQLQFDRLANMMEYNTLESVALIREQMARVVRRKRRLPPGPLVKLSDLPRVSRRFKSEPRSLGRFAEYCASQLELHEGVRDEAQLQVISYDVESEL